MLDSSEGIVPAANATMSTEDENQLVDGVQEQVHKKLAGVLCKALTDYNNMVTRANIHPRLRINPRARWNNSRCALTCHIALEYAEHFKPIQLPPVRQQGACDSKARAAKDKLSQATVM